jgi:hypothetical protein
MENLSYQKEVLAYEKASKRVKELKSFYGNLSSYCLVIPFLFILNILLLLTFMVLLANVRLGNRT